MYRVRCIRGAEIDSLGTLAYLSAPPGDDGPGENIFVLGGLPRTERSYLPDKGLNLRRTLHLRARTGRNPPSNISNASTGRGVYVFCLWSLRYLREALETPRRVHRANVFHLALSLPSPSFVCLGPFFFFFYEKARISLMGSSKRRRPRNSRWVTSIFLLKINGHADTRKKKNYIPFHTKFSTILSHVNFVKAIIRHRHAVFPLSSVSILVLHLLHKKIARARANCSCQLYER